MQSEWDKVVGLAVSGFLNRATVSETLTECLPWWNGQEHKDNDNVDDDDDEHGDDANDDEHGGHANDDEHDDDANDDEHDDDADDDEHGVESVCATCRRLTATDRSCPARLCSTSLPHHLYNTLQVFLYFYLFIFLYFYFSYFYLFNLTHHLVQYTSSSISLFLLAHISNSIPNSQNTLFLLVSEKDTGLNTC